MTLNRLLRRLPGSILQLLQTSLREIVATAPNRTGLKLRQLSWRLVEVSSVFDQADLTAVRATYDALLADPGRLWNVRNQFRRVVARRALNPHLPPEDQLNLLLSLPDDCPLFLYLRVSLEPLPAEVLARRFEAASAAANTRDLTRILFFASGSKADLTPRSRSIIADSLNNTDDAASACAADVAWMAEDADL